MALEINYMDTFPDHLLQEIFIRLPNLTCLLRCSIVCKRWSSIISRSEFTSTFIQHYLSKAPLRLIFRNPVRLSLPPRSSSSSSVVAAGGALDFFPWLHNLFRPNSTSLVAICNDLLLFKSWNHYYVCNPFTGQSSMLPDPPSFEGQSGDIAMCGLISKTYKTKNRKNKQQQQLECIRYRVMLMDRGYMIVFFSEIRQWMKQEFNPTALSAVNCDVDVVAGHGVLYWLGIDGLISYHPFFPFEDRRYYFTPWQIIEYPHGLKIGHATLRLGFFQGRPRLSQLYRVDSHHLCLKFWELKYDAYGTVSLFSVHQVRIEALDAVSVLAFHPSHANQIVMLYNCSIYQYDTETNEQLKVAHVHPSHPFKLPDLRLFLMQPVWPTLLKG